VKSIEEADMAEQTRRRVAVAAVALATAGGLALLPATPAQADRVCTLTENAHQFNNVDQNGGMGAAEHVLHAGRGFHSYEFYYVDGYFRVWVMGYGAEHPNDDGFILWDHTSGC
jgi:hypothetical protein